MATRPSKRARSSAATALPSPRRTRLSLVRGALPQSREELERELLSFDTDDDLASLVPMPATIHPAVREAINAVLAERFECADSLSEWLESPNDVLSGAVPFDCIIDGDGLAVLRALGATEELAALTTQGVVHGGATGALRIVRLP